MTDEVKNKILDNETGLTSEDFISEVMVLIEKEAEEEVGGNQEFKTDVEFLKSVLGKARDGVERVLGLILQDEALIGRFRRPFHIIRSALETSKLDTDQNFDLGRLRGDLEDALNNTYESIKDALDKRYSLRQAREILLCGDQSVVDQTVGLLESNEVGPTLISLRQGAEITETALYQRIDQMVQNFLRERGLVRPSYLVELTATEAEIEEVDDESMEAINKFIQDNNLPLEINLEDKTCTIKLDNKKLKLEE